MTQDAISADAPTIPGYRILGLAGQGAFGTVWFTEECVTGSRRAIKVIPKAARADVFNPEREIQGLRRYQDSASDHANLVQVYHVGEIEDAWYYVMEAADHADGGGGDKETRRQGEDDSPLTTHHSQERQDACLTGYRPFTLAALMKSQGRIPPAEALRITADVLRGLQHLHGHGCVHRDVKPSSVLMIGGRAKLADVGLVTDMDHTITHAGTPGYLPPDDALDHTADLYAVGIMLYEMITGLHRSRFPELPVLQPQTKREHRDLSAAIEIADIAAHPNKRDRYRSAGDFLRGITRCHSPNLISRRRMFLALTAVAIVGGLVSWLCLRPPPWRFTRMKVEEGIEPRFVELRYSDGSTIELPLGGIIAGALEVDFTGKEERTVVVGLLHQGQVRAGLVAFDPLKLRTTGQLQPSHDAGLVENIPSGWDDPSFDARHSDVVPFLAEDLDGLPGEELVVAVRHEQGPCHWIVFARDWKRLTHYWHHGTMTKVVACDLNGDSRKELLCWGIANRRDHPYPFGSQTEAHHLAIMVIDPLGQAGSEAHWSMNEWMNKESATQPLAYGYVKPPHSAANRDWGGEVGLGSFLRVTFWNGLILYLDLELKPLWLDRVDGASFQGEMPEPGDVWVKVSTQ